MAIGIPKYPGIVFRDTFDIIVEDHHRNTEGFLEEISYTAPDNHDDLGFS